MFTGARLSLARRRRGLTKKGLAELISVTPYTILRYENGKMQPSSEVVAKLAAVLNFQKEFFFGKEIDELAGDVVSFRSMAAMTARERDSALAAGSLAFTFTDWVEQRFELPAPDLKDMSGGNPEAAARSLRQVWGLGERPIKNMIHLMEAKGVRVFALAENTKTVDAFSLWRGERPFAFLNMMKTAERSRLDAAHELGHLVLHKHGGPKGRAAEDEANRFAMSFLMPSADILAIAPRVYTLNQIVQLKQRWGVSALALTYRLHALKAITDWQYRTFCIQATQRGMREREENGIGREQSAVWEKVLTTLWSERITKAQIAEQLFVPWFEIENLLFGLASQGEEGGRIAGGAKLNVVPK
jgi:Zn-dependent peptidase ImmA (M78 family)/DNA-binding XRE family transcriptional regulator